IEFRTASNKTVELTEEMRKKAAMLMADLKCPEETEHSNNQTETLPAFKTASNKTLKMTAEMEKRAAILMADLSALQDEPKVENQLKTMSGFRTASNKTLKLTEEMQKKAAMLMADINCNDSQIPTASNTNNKRRLGAMDTKIENIKKETLDEIPLSQWQPMELNVVQKIEIAQPTNDLADNGNLAFETPKCTPESQVSLTHLTELSPLDTATKSSIITRRNLLSLNKRRKLKKDVENMDATQTPARQRFNPMKTATSTPMPSRQEHSQQPLEDVQCSIQKERRFSQDSPRVQRERVGKRRSEEALSPIYAPTNKSRRLGLSRIRNKSSNNI
ncbi:hypothetical protein KR215_006864, partial [Drosophila sulfurigaster]